MFFGLADNGSCGKDPQAARMTSTSVKSAHDPMVPRNLLPRNPLRHLPAEPRPFSRFSGRSRSNLIPVLPYFGVGVELLHGSYSRMRSLWIDAPAKSAHFLASASSSALTDSAKSSPKASHYGELLTNVEGSPQRPMPAQAAVVPWSVGAHPAWMLASRAQEN